MPRTEAQNEWRKNHKPNYVRVELTDETLAEWKMYAEKLGLPVGTMLRQCVKRCMEMDEWKTVDQ